jgi:hypothetical protein
VEEQSAGVGMERVAETLRRLLIRVLWLATSWAHIALIWPAGERAEMVRRLFA